MTSSANCWPGSRPPSASSSRAGGWSWSRSIRSRIASSRPSWRPAPAPGRAPPAAGRSAAGELHDPHQTAGRTRRGRNGRQPARALGEAARRRAQRRARQRVGPAGAAAAAVTRRRDTERVTLMRLLHLVVVAALVCAAVYVYKIKFDSALQVERVAKLRSEIRRERDAIATLRAEWSQLDNPIRIQGLAQRHLALKPIDATQFDALDRLPERPADAG